MFSYVMVLASVIIGLGITHLLTGLAGIVQHPASAKVYWVHLVWVGATFLRAIFWWWFEFQFSAVGQWTFGLYFFVLAYALLIYFWCALLFPRDLAGYDGYKDYFYARKRWFFGVALVAQFADIPDTMLKGMDHFNALGATYLIGLGTMGVLFIIALWTRNERFHGFLALVAVAWFLVYPVTSLDTVQSAPPVAVNG